MADYCAQCGLEVDTSVAANFLKCNKCSEVIHIQCHDVDTTKKPKRRATYTCTKCSAGTLASTNSSDSEEPGTAAILRAIQALDAKVGNLEKKLNENMENKFAALERKI